MTQSIERVLNTEGAPVFTITADTGMKGVAIDTVGIWYDHSQIALLMAAIQRANDFLTNEGVV